MWPWGLLMIKFFCSLCGLGYLPAPGTVASFVTTLFFWWYGHVPLMLGLCSVVFIYVLLLLFAHKHPQEKDPSYVVLDEVAGQIVAMLWLPRSYFGLLLCFSECLIFLNPCI